MHTLLPDELCRVVQDDKRSEPLILLRKGGGQPVETLTIQQAQDVHSANITVEHTPTEDCWYCALSEVLIGIR